VPPPSASDAEPSVVRLHPIRTLVLSADPAYCERALAVLGDLGPVAFAQLAPGDGDGVADTVALARHEQPDVVVLDATGAEAGAGLVMLALSNAAMAVGLVVVCEHSTPGARRLAALPKWGWTQDLRRAVERASVDREAELPAGLVAADSAGPPGPLAGWAEDGPVPGPAP
jgi:hypothetical protein